MREGDDRGRAGAGPVVAAVVRRLHFACYVRPFRVMTYNVRSCTVARAGGAVERVAAVVRAHAPDLLALQEVEAGHRRSGLHDQARALGEALGMSVHFQPAMRGPGEATFGNA